jgi:hypothetical protein
MNIFGADKKNCIICDKKFDKLKGLATHIFKIHNLKSKEYYDLYLLNNDENCCVICSKITSFRGLGVGYLKHCSCNCRDNNKEIKHNYWLGKKQSVEHISNRLKNTNEIDKEEKKKKTLLLRYGYDNPSKIPASKVKLSILSKNKKKPRTEDWQKKIIDSKRKNGTLNHSEQTKKKLSDSISNYYLNNLDREKYLHFKGGKNFISGWYNNIFFRSSLELSFLHRNNHKNIVSCETNEFKVEYLKNGLTKCYYPDFYDGLFIYEIKPSSLIKLELNILKINEAIKKYSDSFNIITEKECPYLTKDEIIKLVESKNVILTKKGVISFINYRLKK